ncbi:MAG TPA: S9 family peptidase [Thermomicrobiales bacterium]|nr:S9 family peptidase [Thermomicrobiales bacterium]
MAEQARQTPDIALEDLVRVPGVQAFDLSPDGRQAVFTWNASGNFQISVVPLDGGAPPRQLTDGPQAAMMPRWSPRGDLIAYLQDTGGNENTNIFLIAPEGGAARQFTDTPGAANNMHDWSPDGGRLAFSSNRHGHFDVYVQSLAGGEARRLTDALAPDRDLRWSPDGTVIAFSSNRDEDRNNLDVFAVKALDAPNERQLTPAEGTAHEHSGRWSPDGRNLVYVSDARGYDDIMLVGVADGRATPLTQNEYEEESPEWAPDGTRVAYLVNRDGNVGLAVKSLATGRVTTIPTGPGVVLGFFGVRFTPDGQSLVFVHSSGQRPFDLCVAPADGSAAPRRLTDSLAAAGGTVDPDWLVQPEVVRWRSADGTAVPGLLYRPRALAANGGPPPAIVYVHGGPTGQTTNMWNPTIQYYVNHGYAVLAPNVRGSTGYGRDYRDANLKDWGGGDLADLVAGAEYLAAEGLADRHSIGVTGGSYGGYMTLIAMTKAPRVWAAGVSVVGIANLRTLYERTRDDLQYYLVQQIGTPEDNSQLYDDRSAINFVHQVEAPLLILQGETDPRVPLHEAEQMRDLLAQHGKTHELHVYPQEGHGFRKEENRLDAARRTVAFFDRYLKG